MANDDVTGVVDSHAHFWFPRPPSQPLDTEDLHPAAGIMATSHDEFIALMDVAGVEQLMHVTPMREGFDNAQALAGADKYPGRIAVFIRFDVESPDGGARLRAEATHPAIVGIRLTCVKHSNTSQQIFEPEYRSFWEAAAEMGLAVSFYGPGNLVQLGERAAEIPELQIVIDHAGADMFPGVQYDERFANWPDLMKLTRCENVAVKVSGMPEVVPETFPFPSVQERIRTLRDEFGADRLMWASNYPNSGVFSTYTQSLEYVRDGCDFLNAAERTAILGGNARRLLRLPRAAR